MTTTHKSISVVLGPRVLGKDAFEEQQLARALQAGPVGLGKRANQPFVPPEQRVHAESVKKAAPSAASVPLMPANPVLPVSTVFPIAPPEQMPLKGKGAKGKAAAVPPGSPGFSEQQVAEILAEDPNRWPFVLEAESSRPEGPRPRVAALVLDIQGSPSLAAPISDEVVVALRAVIGAAGEEPPIITTPVAVLAEE